MEKKMFKNKISNNLNSPNNKKIKEKINKKKDIESNGRTNNQKKLIDYIRLEKQNDETNIRLRILIRILKEK